MKTAYVIVGVTVVVGVVAAIVLLCALFIPRVHPSLQIYQTSRRGHEFVMRGNVSKDARPTFQFDDIWRKRFSYKSIHPQWDSTTEDDDLDFVQKNDKNEFVRRRIDNPHMDIEIIVPVSFYETYACDHYSMSKDGKYVLCRHSYQQVWRNSYTAGYAFWDVSNKTEINLSGFPNDTLIQYITWSPTGHKLAYVHNYNVYMIPDLAATSPVIMEVSPTNGQKNLIYYGIPSWMYEEEMMFEEHVLYWSPGSEKIAFLQTNNTGVNLIKYPWYGHSQYPKTVEIAYPKAGTTVENVKMWVVDLAVDLTAPSPAFEMFELVAPNEFEGSDYYFSRFTWKNATACLVTWINRLQNQSIAQICHQKESGFAFNCSHYGPFYPKWKSGSRKADYYTIYARNNAENTDGFWQVALVQEGQRNIEWMTNTSYDIVGLTYYDKINEYLYFRAAYDLPRRRQILRVKSTDRDATEPECMTCKFWQEYPDRCGWVWVDFAEDGRKVVVNCEGPRIPLTVWMAIDENGRWGNTTELELNQELQSMVSSVKWPVREFGIFPSSKYPDKGYNFEIWRPADFDASKTYPLLIYVYAGPESQEIQEKWWRSFSQTYMVSNRNIIVASVDGRGSAYAGWKLMRQAYKKLGQNEPEDQTDFAKYLIETHDYIDSSRVAIWGWSYGGYITTNTLAYDGGRTFRCGVAVAPVADWCWYDAMYTERYMQKPTENPEGYQQGSLITGSIMENLKNVSYTLIHGTADDNVHFQNAAAIAKALVEADVDFASFFYTDQTHAINLGNAEHHVFHQLDLRLSYCLGKVNSPYATG